MGIDPVGVDDSPAVQAHLTISQSVIQRMAGNSTSCKAWCITLVSAILVVVADKGKTDYAVFAAIPTALFLALDAYYLSLERRFRTAYNTFIGKLHGGRVVASDLYVITPSGAGVWTFVTSLLSFSIWPFYGMLGVMIWLTKRFIHP